MGDTTLRTIDELLTGVMDDVEDSDARYKLRSARQLLAVMQQRNDEIDELIENIDDEELLENLRSLGYVE